MELPPDFRRQMQSLLPDTAAFEQALEAPSPVAIRLNPAKTQPLNSLTALPWCRMGYVLPERPSFTLDPRFHAGAYYVQDASCMALEAVLQQLALTPIHILDACAAPGGKASHLASLYPDSLVLANETIRSRATILAENTAKWGHGNLVLSQLDPSGFRALPDFFDLMLADVPCSGEGLFRKDQAARAEWSLANVELSARRQRRILTELWPSLKPGGILIYSTCTYNRQENEAQIEWLQTEFGAEAVDWQLPEAWPLIQADVQGIHTLRCYPHMLPGEGFFLAAVRKPAGPSLRPRSAAKFELLRPKDCERFSHWLKGDWYFSRQGEHIMAWPQAHLDSLRLLHGALPIQPLTLAEVKGKDLRPSQALALALDLHRPAFAELPLDHEQAIAYLQRQALYDLPAGPKGFTLAAFGGWPLGWLKQIDSRANNLYPQGWHIRMQPDASTRVQAWERLQQVIPLESA
ncbi:MAG: rRNA cytosine-C5-methyltransferase [Candidatus Melainabacteria bacterium HGW-Melainabacteria-1]|nr:MAG: rRNA cytosine-C5-methyltransferase [Candidatus Melainabacteria bacterium HGW-Melainabacteria-1]